MSASTSRSKWKRAAILVGSALVALLLLAMAALQTETAGRYLLGKAQDYLRTQRIGLSAESLRLGLSGPSITMEGVVLRSLVASDLPAFLFADRADVDVGFLNLLRGVLAVDEANLSDLRLHVVTDEAGRTNLPPGQEAPQEEPSGTPDFLLSRIRVEPASFRYENRGQAMRAELPVWNLSIDGDAVTLDHGLRMRSEAAGAIEWQDRSLPIDPVVLDGRLSPERLQIDLLQLAVGDSRLRGSGTVRDLSDPELNLDLRADLDLPALSGLVRPGLAVSGRVETRLSVTGPADAVRVAAALEGKDLTYEDWPGTDLSARAAWDSGAQTVEVRSLSLSSPMGALTGRGRVALAAGAGDSHVRAEIRKLDLEAVSRALGGGIRIASLANASLEGRWPGLDVQEANGNLELQLAPTRPAPAVNVLPVSGRISLRAREGRAELQIHRLHSLAADLRGRIVLGASGPDPSYTNGALGGSAEVLAPRLDLLARRIAAFHGGAPGAPIPGDRLGGAARISLDLGGTIQAPRLRARLDARDVRFGDWKDLHARAEADYRREELIVRDLEVGTGAARLLTAGGSVGLAGHDPPLRLDVHLRDAPIAPAISAFARGGGPAPMEGALSAHASVRGTRGRPRGEVDFKIESLRAWGEELGVLAGEGEIDGQERTSLRVRLEKPLEGGATGALLATATYVPRSREYELRVESEELLLRHLQIPQAGRLRGSLAMSGSGSGTLDDPRLSFEIAGDDLSIEDREIGAVHLRGRIAEGTARVETDIPRFALSGAAEMGIEAPRPWNVKLSAEGMDLSLLPIRTAPEDALTGRLTASIEGSGNLQELRASTALVEAQDFAMSFRNQPVRIDRPLRVRYQDRVLAVESASFVSEDSRVAMEGTLPIEAAAGEGELELTGELSLTDLARFVPLQNDLAVEGRMSVEASLSGSLDRLDPFVSVRMEDGSFTNPALSEPVRGIDLDVELAEGLLQWKRLAAEAGTARLQASGQAPISVLGAELPFGLAAPNAPIRLALDLHDAHLNLVKDVPERLNGNVSMELRAEASDPDLASLRATLELPDLSIESGEYRIEQATPSSISVSEGVLRVDSFHLRGPRTELDVTGTAELTGSRRLDLAASGLTELGSFAAGMEGVQLAGESRFDVAIGGTVRDPDLSGSLQLDDAQLAIETPEIAATDLNARVRFQGSGIEIEALRADLNGGRLDVSGGVRYAAGELTDVNLEIEAEEVYLEFPLELQTMTSSNITVGSRDGLTIIGGRVQVLRGSYTDPLEIEDQILEFLRQGEEPELPEERSPLLARLRYDLDLVTVAPIVMDNNLAEMALTFELGLTGTYYEPGLTGRLDLEEGGEIYLRENTYVVRRGVISFLDETRIRPALDVLATTRAADYDITLQVSGVAGELETTLTSDPPLPEVDILAVLATGRTLEEFRGEEVHVAREHLLSYLAGRSVGRITRGLEKTTGLSEVRVEPHLVAAESDPIARLTIGQDINPDLRLVYSTNLADTSDRIYIAEYEVTRQFTTMATQQEDNSYRLDVRHRLELGGSPSAGESSPSRPAAAELRIGTTTFSGNETLPDDRIAEIASLRSGYRYDFFAARDAKRRVENLYRELGHLEARVELAVDEQSETADLELRIDEGPRVAFVLAGAEVSEDVQQRVREAWSEGFFDRQRAAEAAEAIRTSLAGRHFFGARIGHSIELDSAGVKTVRFTIEPGSRYEDFELVIAGGAGIEASRRDELLEALDARNVIHTDPRRVTEALSDLYASEGYLDVEVDEPQYELEPERGAARVILRIREGPSYAVRRIELRGNDALTDAELRRLISIQEDTRYRLEDRRNAVSAIEQAYWRRGYNDVVVSAGTSQREEAAAVDLVFEIEEGRQEVVRDIVIEGTEKTTEAFVRGQLAIGKGDILILDRVSQSRQNLYETGAFAMVEIEREEGTTALDGDQQPVDLRVEVREVSPYSIRYGGSYDTENGPGGIVDLMNRNSLGNARTVGLRGRYDGWLREMRGYFSQPLLKSLPLKTNATVFYSREYLSRDEGEELISTRRGFSLDQEMHLRNEYVFSLGYRYEWNEVAALVADSDLAGIVPPHTTAPVTATLTRDTRDEILDATRGSFSSHAFEWAPELLGSDIGYVRYLGQYNAYISLSAPSEIPWVGTAKSRWVYAGSVRIGLAAGIDGPSIPLARRFFAGGGTSVRGFDHNAIGPRTGGNAVLISNHELRFPLVSFFDGAGFLDVGNVYETAGDFDAFDLRETAGLGLRVRTPYFLLRLDYGFLLDRRPGEPPGAFFFSIGQAF